jgi:hypothetical protein
MSSDPFRCICDLMVSRRDAARQRNPPVPSAGGCQTFGARHLVQDERVQPSPASVIDDDIRNKQLAKEALP